MPPVITKEELTAYERWELQGFGGSAPAARKKTPASEHPAVKLPTADEIDRIHQDAHRQGYAAGYDEGTARARMEAMRLHSLVENLDGALKTFDQAMGEDLLALALEIARQVIGQAVTVKPEIVLDTVRDALLQLPHQHAAVYLHPEDAALVRTHLGEQLSHFGQRIFEDPNLERGGCRIDVSGSQVDASLPTRWRRVVDALGVKSDWIVR